MSAADATTMADIAQRRRLELKPLITRLAACLAGGVVLALMWGEQEGTQDDYGFAFHQAVFKPRILVFLGIGLAAFLAITFWPKVRPYLTKPGMPSYLAGVATVIASYVLLHWYDPISGQKLSDLADLVDADAVQPSFRRSRSRSSAGCTGRRCSSCSPPASTRSPYSSASWPGSSQGSAS